MMKLSMLKLLMIASLLSTSIYANTSLDDKLLDYEQKRVGSILKRQGIDLGDVTIALKKQLPQQGWYGYAFNLSFEVKGKKINQKDFLFSNGELIAPDLINFTTKRSMKNVMYPTLSKKFFSKDHLIAGNPNAKHTLVIFSDPLCPICVDEVPGIMKKIIDNPKNIALYYYHMPLAMHPTAKTLAIASMIARDMGIKDVDYTLYKLNAKYFYGEDKDKLYDPYTERDNQKALDYFNKHFKTNITMAQINDPKYAAIVQHDEDMAEDAFVQGTPTIFFDGEVDKRRDKFEQFLK
ncbi:MAG: DsbA family protein [Campylobacterales bacterium]|nr:DsbA family protein [Campylobacterales bacterium]